MTEEIGKGPVVTAPEGAPAEIPPTENRGKQFLGRLKSLGGRGGRERPQQARDEAAGAPYDLAARQGELKARLAENPDDLAAKVNLLRVSTGLGERTASEVLIRDILA